MDTVLEEDDQQLRVFEQTDITNQNEFSKVNFRSHIIDMIDRILRMVTN